MDQPDKLTQTRGSLQANNSFIQKMYRCFCPCVVSASYNDRKTQVYFDSEVSNRSDSMKTRIKQLQMPRTTNIPHNMSFTTSNQNQNEFKMSPQTKSGSIKKIKSKTFLVNSTIERKNNYMAGQQKNMQNTRKRQWHNYPIYKYNQENELIIMGKGNHHLLVEISTVYLDPSIVAVKKQYASKPNETSQNYYNKILDDFWNRRYFCFEKFDQGIQIDEASMKSIQPEIVSDYIAGKCDQCKTALDAFSGIGSNALKLGMVCEKVICVEQDCKKYKYLINNAKVYQIQNVQLFLKPFIEIELKNNVDVVFVKPYLLNDQVLQSSCCNTEQFQPSLDKIIKKSLQISENLILLLPSNINIQKVCQIISFNCHGIDKVFSTCSAKIQKICFKNSLSYVAVFFGPKVQKTIKLNDELGFMYKVLKNKYEKTFQHKKLLKKLRQIYGMVKLLNFIYESKKCEGKTQSEKLFTYVRQQKLITQEKIQRIIQQQSKQKEKKHSRMNSSNNMAVIDQKTSRSSVNQMQDSGNGMIKKNSDALQQAVQDKTQSQRTQSFYSNYSGFSNMKKNYFNSSFAQSSKKASEKDRLSNNSSSILIKRTDGSLQRDGTIILAGSLQKDNRFQSGSLQKESKSPASPNLMPRGTQMPVRGSLNLDMKRIQRQLNHSTKYQIKKSLIAKIQEQI